MFMNVWFGITIYFGFYCDHKIINLIFINDSTSFNMTFSMSKFMPDQPNVGYDSRASSSQSPHKNSHSDDAQTL